MPMSHKKAKAPICPVYAQTVPGSQGYQGPLAIPANVVLAEMRILDKPEPIRKKSRDKRGTKR